MSQNTSKQRKAQHAARVAELTRQNGALPQGTNNQQGLVRLAIAIADIEIALAELDVNALTDAIRKGFSTKN